MTSLTNSNLQKVPLPVRCGKDSYNRVQLKTDYQITRLLDNMQLKTEKVNGVLIVPSG